MSKKGTVKCRTCNKEFEGILPDNLDFGFHYLSIDGEVEEQLVKTLQEHHIKTLEVKELHGYSVGHMYYDVSLRDGSKGKLEANSYFVIYKELGKER